MIEIVKLKDLRIGNWIIIHDANKQNIQYKVQMDIENFNDIDSSNYFTEGIPLTEEILTKAGFRKDKDGVLKKHNCMYWLDNGYLQIALNYAPIINCKCKYVHQLQNLYFALTDEELDIKL